MKVITVLIISMSLILSGCGYKTQARLAPALGYKKFDSFYGTGYEDWKIGKNKYEIVVTGHAMTTDKRLLNLATARAAHIGIENKYKYFKILSKNPSVKCYTKYVNSRRANTMVSGRLRMIVMYSQKKEDGKYQLSHIAFKKMQSKLTRDPRVHERLKSHDNKISVCNANQPQKL